MNRPINSNKNANGDDLQAEPQAQRFNRVSDSATRRVFVYRAKRRLPKSPLRRAKIILFQNVRIFVTADGLYENEYAEDVRSSVVLDDLFRSAV